MISFSNVNAYYNKQQVLKNINVSFEEGQCIGIIGPNGSGKSTLLKALMGLVKIDGDIHIDDKTIRQLSPNQLAKRVGILEQKYSVPDYYSVFDIVMMGNYLYKKWWEFESKEDIDRVNEVLERLDLTEYKDKAFVTLSGGEQQRVMVARTLIQNPKYLLLDEPTNHLDIFYQIDLMQLVKTKFHSIIAVVHDINLAMNFCDQVIVVNNGEIVEQGETKQILTEELISKYFKVPAIQVDSEALGTQLISVYHQL
ncbi:ABC transporter ATP-binding protein [Tuanshanicoccus lijuaniae]|uniref:ABC transporter ATP-binding protein n=1 Tax=Aerococcaceae bacterium zg-1292 TaxID=2774330 RepID=UPI0019383B3D|nr:ABC transporter ATP-binding protein [Aerococcaceae bacterium zg-1292]MBS4456465.1 ABC transporter ATP-binding protein [Aerococcaceae bacterium zg-A91]MBS4458315.1 ABC transporter ATP-binding protein [Aerococcaceae bacterium zg-BR33]QQA37452.1 ABC transporter ATP-binding protein [Aerococcaceae bacterium zg-1292]